MNKVVELLEKKLMPVAIKIQSNRYLMAIRDGFMGMMPLLIIGSLFLLVANLPIPGYTEFLTGLLGEHIGILTYIFDATYNFMGLLVVIGIVISLSRGYKLPTSSLLATVIASFILLIPLNFEMPIEEGATQVVQVVGALQVSYLNSSGVFVAMIVAIVSVEIFRFIVEKKWTIKMPETVPTEVANSFTSLYPALFVLLFWLAVKVLFQFTNFDTFQNFIYTTVQMPLMWLGNSLISQVVSELMIAIFWCFGIHGDSVVSSIMGPIWTALSSENLEAIQQGMQPVNIITQQFRDVFIIAGGTGATFSLIIAVFINCKSKVLRDISKLATPAAIFNINEPIIFGIPIVLNPILMIPFILVPLIQTILTYVVMSIGLVPLTNGVALPWTTPVLISGFLACGIPGLILQIVNLVIGYFVYLPFVKVQDEIYLKAEIGIESE